MVGMLLLVDGYNVTMRDEAVAGWSKERQREDLLGRLRKHASRLAPKGEIVVVFDARGQIGISATGERPVRAVFAPDADDEIVRRCLQAVGQVSVATDDMRLRARLSQDVGRHVRFVDGVDLLDENLAEGTASCRSQGRMRCDEGLPRGADEITEELGRIWGVSGGREGTQG